MLNRSRQKGFTIIEIMIALALGVLLSSALIQIFGSSKNLASMEMSLSRMQETGRFALEAIAKDVRMAGYQGCADPHQLDLTVIAKKFQTGGNFDFAAIKGYEVAAGSLTPDATGTEMANLIGVARTGSDILSLTHASLVDAQLTSDTGNSAQISVTAIPPGMEQGDFAIISDCKSAHLFEVVNVPNNTNISHGGNVNEPHNKLTPPYPAGAQLMSFENRVYFVADTGRDTESGADVYSLYVKEFDGNRQEILEGVESLQILYGEQLEGGAVRFVTADDANLDWDRVVSVRIGLLVQGFAQVADTADTNTYALPGANISNAGTGAHAGDRALRKPFTATILLRNRRQQILQNL